MLLHIAHNQPLIFCLHALKLLPTVQVDAGEYSSILALNADK